MRAAYSDHMEAIEDELARIEALPLEDRPAALEELERRLRALLDEAAEQG